MDCVIKPYPGERWGFDNGAFAWWRKGVPFQGDIYQKRLDRAYRVGTPYLAVVPDLVGMGAASIECSEAWREKLPADWPWYLALQDGMSLADVEAVLPGYRGLFLGGTTAFKSRARYWCEVAHRWRVPFHYGRCGTAYRVQHARDVGADSLDSTGPLWTKVKMDRFRQIVTEGHEQNRLAFHAGA